MRAWRARLEDHPLPGITAHAEESEAAVTVVEASCPGCGKPAAVLLRHTTMLLPLDSPGMPQ